MSRCNAHSLCILSLAPTLLLLLLHRLFGWIKLCLLCVKEGTGEERRDATESERGFSWPSSWSPSFASKRARHDTLLAVVVVVVVAVATTALYKIDAHRHFPTRRSFVNDIHALGLNLNAHSQLSCLFQSYYVQYHLSINKIVQAARTLGARMQFQRVEWSGGG